MASSYNRKRDDIDVELSVVTVIVEQKISKRKFF